MTVSCGGEAVGDLHRCGFVVPAQGVHQVGVVVLERRERRDHRGAGLGRVQQQRAQSPEAFGRPIGNFQSLAHAMADLQTEIDSARLLGYRAAWLLTQGQPCTREGSMAKLKGSETYVAAARLGMQVCAGHGFSTESVMSFRHRESVVATISGGTSQIQRNGIVRSMGLRSY
ncbi:acyl-CoA dehydrogenase family protein [Streptomyces sp. NPDC005356]|uniref:acyl-CoA dehydrogenase family protein n=1 Tax=Streptomyces sp. NPDC005356 TaxID=3157167 RepID=UPI0033B77089